MNMFRKYRWILICLLLFFVSRLLFLNPGGVFFDSNEYLDLFEMSDYFQAIVSGHFPPHVGYIIFFWPLYHLAELILLPPDYLVVIIQAILATITMYCFYSVAAFLTNKKVALYASLIAVVIPLFWIVTSTIMMENAYITLFFLSLFLLIKWLSTRRSLLLHLSLACFALAFLTNMLTILWFPLCFWIVLTTQKKSLLVYTFLTGCYVAGFILLNLFFISAVSDESLSAVFHHLYLTKTGEFSVITMTPRGILIASRNFLIPFMRNNTSLLVLLSFAALILAWFQDKRMFVLGFFWIIPAFFTNQWWDSLLMGRHALIAGFGLAFLTAYLLRKTPALLILFLVYMVITAIPTLRLLREPVPYLIEAASIRDLPKDSLLIETHFAKPQVQRTFPGTLAAVNDPLWPVEKIQTEIDTHLAARQPVYVSSGALSEPYGLYSGPYLHSLTLSYLNPPLLNDLLKNYTVEQYRVINEEDNLILYSITSASPSAYPEVKQLRNSERRLDAADPFTRVWLRVTKQ